MMYSGNDAPTDLAETRTLFSAGPRTRTTPRRHGESSYRLLDQAASPFWARVRARLDAWYREWPANDADLARRFTDDDPAQHYGAFWELYLHESLRLAGFTLSREPRITGRETGPDFLAVKRHRSILLEATTAFPGSESERKRVVFEGAIYDEFDKTRCSHWLDVNFVVSGKASPPVRKMREQLEGALGAADGRELTWRWQGAGWCIEVQAVPRHLPPRRLGQTPIRPCGIFSPSDSSLDERPAPLREALLDKRTRYGRPDMPFVIAVLAELSVHSSFGSASRCAELADPISAFFATKGNEHVSAVVTAALLKPWSIARRFPVLWPNPNAAHVVKRSELPWPEAADDVNRHLEEERLAADLLGLPPGWPGPEASFPSD